MRSPELPSHLKPLYANLLRIGIPSFLLTNSFEHLMIENDWDQLWDRCLEAAHRLSNVAVLVAGYTGYVQDALGFFIGAVGSAEPETLFSFIYKLLETYLKSTRSSFDLSSLRSPLVTAGYKEEDVDSLLIELQAIKASIPDVQNKIQEIDGLNSISLGTHSTDTSQALDQVIQLCSRFHVVARQLRRRHDNRQLLMSLMNMMSKICFMDYSVSFLMMSELRNILLLMLVKLPAWTFSSRRRKLLLK